MALQHALAVYVVVRPTHVAVWIGTDIALKLLLDRSPELVSARQQLQDEGQSSSP